MWYCEIYLDICNNSELECIWGGEKDQEMCIKKIRKWEDIAMSQCVNGWLIHSSLSPAIGWFTFSGGLKAEDADIQMKEDVSVCISEELLLCSLSLFEGGNSFRMCFQAHFGALIYLVAMNYWRGNFYPWVTPPGSWPAEHPARKVSQKVTAHTVSCLAVDCITAL